MIQYFSPRRSRSMEIQLGADLPGCGKMESLCMNRDRFCFSIFLLKWKVWLLSEMRWFIINGKLFYWVSCDVLYWIKWFEILIVDGNLCWDDIFLIESYKWYSTFHRGEVDPWKYNLGRICQVVERWSLCVWIGVDSVFLFFFLKWKVWPWPEISIA